ncbi:hypothetical protein WMY93_006756 [Mugilogobius chulae]|uniref:Uncharacterized protein n=1 Tax=Mugilogobius chulae TaxID=88201 RepID=A0AAW0PPI8_9GOBI
MDWDNAQIINQETNKYKRWIKEAAEMRKRGPRTLNRDEGALTLLYVEQLLQRPPSGGGRGQCDRGVVSVTGAWSGGVVSPVDLTGPLGWSRLGTAADETRHHGNSSGGSSDDASGVRFLSRVDQHVKLQVALWLFRWRCGSSDDASGWVCACSRGDSGSVTMTTLAVALQVVLWLFRWRCGSVTMATVALQVMRQVGFVSVAVATLAVALLPRRL